MAGEQALGERFARSIGRGCACRELTVEEEHRGLPVWSVAAGIAAQKRRGEAEGRSGRGGVLGRG